jgi:hypothetical protein
MVAKEFLSELKEAREVFSWQFQERNQQIRGFLKTGETRAAFDPIAALAFTKSGRAFAQGDWLRAGTMLGLSEDDCAAIIDSANNRLWKYVDDQLVLDGYDEWLHAELISAVGLEPEFDFDLSTPTEETAFIYAGESIPSPVEAEPQRA